MSWNPDRLSEEEKKEFERLKHEVFGENKFVVFQGTEAEEKYNALMLKMFQEE
jgi:hypothetical protein